jgi:hypothetical protein
MKDRTVVVVGISELAALTFNKSTYLYYDYPSCQPQYCAENECDGIIDDLKNESARSGVNFLNAST